MSHYDLAQWADYIRGVTSAGHRVDMTQHLDTCLVCGITVNLLQSAADAAAADRAFNPPAQVIETAERLFPGASRAGERITAGLRRIIAAMTCNGAPETAPSGVRSLRAESRHFKYRASHYSVDLQFDTLPNATMVGVTGQISDEAMPDIPLGDTQVILLLDGTFVTSTGTNEFGEFYLQCEPSTRLHLLVPIEDAGDCIELPLNLAFSETNQT